MAPTGECTRILLQHQARHTAPQNVCFLTYRQSMPGHLEQFESSSPHVAKDLLPDLKHAYFKKTSVFSSQIHTCRTTYAFLTTLLHACLRMSVCMCPRRQKRMLEPWSYRWP